MLLNKKITFNALQRAFSIVQGELEELGLWAEDYYLWHVDLVQSPLPSLWGELGYVFDEGVSTFDKILGYREHTIYIPSYAPTEAYVPGGTLVDTIRHEFGHCWAAIDPKLFSKKWFKEAFGFRYWDENPLGYDLYKVFSKHADSKFKASPYYQDYVSAYALSAPYEDFAETFMVFLKYRNRLEVFSKRPGLYKKLTSIKKIVKTL